MIFLIKKLVGNFFILPGLYLLILTFAVINLKKKKLATFLLSLLFLLIYFPSTRVGRDLILKPLEDAYPYPKNPKCSYIVVLGGGITPHSPSQGGGPSVRPPVALRLYEAYKLWKSLKVPIVVSGGKVLSNQPESRAMKEFLLTLGVPKEEVIEESKSRTTFENALYTKEIVKGEKVCLITSAYHMPRSVMIFKAFKFKIIPVPADYRASRGIDYDLLSFIPFPTYLKDSMDGFREYVGIAFFKLVSSWRAREDSNLRPTD